MNLNVCNVVDPETGTCHVVAYPPSVQVIGEPTLSDSKLRYCGCDFPAAAEIQPRLEQDQLFKVATSVGKALYRKYGWKGMFGIDFILRPDGSMIFLEINPRLQSSTHLLDIEFRDEWNPMLLQIESFLGDTCRIKEDVDLTHRPVESSMLVAYNNFGEDLLTVDPGAIHPGTSGFPLAGKTVAPGGVLFRHKTKGRVLGPDLQTLNENNRKVVQTQIDTSFSNLDRTEAALEGQGA